MLVIALLKAFYPQGCTVKERAGPEGRTGSAGSEICALLAGCAPTVYHRGVFIVPHGAPEGYEWFVALVVLVGLYFAVRNFVRARR